MIIRNRTDGGYEELYPKTLADNVLLNNGKSLQDEIDSDNTSIEIIDDTRENSTSKTIIFNNKFFIFSAEADLVSVTQNKYIRSSVLFPFDNAGFFTATANLVAASGSLEDTTHVYIREKHANRVQVSTIGDYGSNDEVTVDVQVVGVLE